MKARSVRAAQGRAGRPAAAFDAFVTDLVNGRWLELGDEGEVAYGPRAILELADVLRGHGAEVPQIGELRLCKPCRVLSQMDPTPLRPRPGSYRDRHRGSSSALLFV